MNTQAQFEADLLSAIGTPYVFGGDAPGGFDCSGLPYWASGNAIPRTSEAQFAGMRKIPAGQQQRDDLCFYNVNTDNQPQPAHVSVVWNPAGGSEAIIEAPRTGEDVKFSPQLAYPIMGYARISFAGGNVPPGPSPSEPEIKLGSTGSFVRLAQTIMVNHAAQHIAEDGVFGPNTAAAVANVQKLFKLRVDGDCGPATWAVLNYLNTLK